MTKASIEHVNTGCLYEADGQKVTILREGRETHFFDHSRMVDGTLLQKGELTAMEVIRAYVKGEYKHTTFPMERRIEVRDYHHSVEFKDISSAYKRMVIFGF